MNSAVSPVIAEELLGISVASLCTSKRYAPFYTKATEGKRNATFNVKEYLKYEQFKEQVVSMSHLFVEYLYHIEGWTYSKIYDTARIKCRGFDYGYKSALEMLARFRYAYPFHVTRFDLYYGYKIQKRMEKYVTTQIHP